MNPDLNRGNIINSDVQNLSEQRLVWHIKLLCTLTVITTVFIFTSNKFLTNDPIFANLSIMVGSCYFVMLLLLQFGKQNWYKTYFSVIMPVWAVIIEFFIGFNSFGHGILSISFGITTFLLFQEKRRLRSLLLCYTALMYLGSSIYTYLYGSLYSFDYPFDQMLVYINCMLWVIVIFSYYEHKMGSFISVLTSKNKELKQKKNELERFNYLASHDLKTPIRTITSFLGLINRDIEREQYTNVKEYSNYAISGAHQMQNLLEGILEISKIKMDFTDEQLQLIDLNILLNNVKRKMSFKLRGKAFNIYSDPLPKIMGISSDFEIIFEEILENGIRYNNSRMPEVFISCSTNGKEVALIFKDNGIGISKAYHDQIFHFFKRLHSIKDYPGTGLGLGLCRKIVDKYDGWIEVDSDYGASSTFITKFPKRILVEKAPEKQLRIEFSKAVS